MRGIHRWDQWLGLGLAVAATLVLGRLLRAVPRRRGVAVLAFAAPLLALDLWPRHVPAQEVPGPSPFDALLRTLPEDAAVAVFPIRRLTSERAWAEQLSHGRRVVNGFWSYEPPIHSWLSTFGKTRPFEATFAAFSELGASAVELDLAALPPAEAARIDALVSGAPFPRVLATARAGSRRLLLLEPVAPLLVDPRTLSGLRFEGAHAVVAASPGRLVFRLGSESLEVVVPEGSGTRRDVLRVPVVGGGSLVATLSRPLERGAVVRAADDGREIGRESSGPAAR